MRKALRLGLVGVAWICAGLAVWGFFLPWVRIDLHEPAMMKKIRQAIPLQGTMRGLEGTVKGFTHDVSRIAVKIRRGAETITGDINLQALKEIPREITGAQIPPLANSQQAQAAMVIMELLTGKRQEAGPQSYAVYLVPGLAVLAAVLLTTLGRLRPVAFGLGIACALIAIAGFWKLLATNIVTPVMAVTIGPGLWLSLWAYVGLAVAAAAYGIVLAQSVRAAPPSKL